MMPNTVIRSGGRRRRRNNLMHLHYHLCFTNFIHHSPQPPSISSSSPHIDLHRPSPSSTTTKSIIKNFNTLYDHTSSLDPEPQPADFATAFASQRFFFSSPGRSNSIVESTSSSSSLSSPPSLITATTVPPPQDTSSSSAAAAANKNKVLFEGSVAVQTYSPDPYLDFRRSMQEMVEARPEVVIDVKSNLEVLHELLLCYLALNPKSTHKFILGAFADLLVSLMPVSSSSSRSLPPPENANLDDVAGGVM